MRVKIVAQWFLRFVLGTASVSAAVTLARPLARAFSANAAASHVQFVTLAIFAGVIFSGAIAACGGEFSGAVINAIWLVMLVAGTAIIGLLLAATESGKVAIGENLATLSLGVLAVLCGFTVARFFRSRSNSDRTVRIK